jgi:hypothetical protein
MTAAPTFLVRPHRCELSGDRIRIPKTRDRSLFRIASLAIGGGGLTQMILDLLVHASRGKWIETKFAREGICIGLLEGTSPWKDPA